MEDGVYVHMPRVVSLLHYTVMAASRCTVSYDLAIDAVGADGTLSVEALIDASLPPANRAASPSDATARSGLGALAFLASGAEVDDRTFPVPIVDLGMDRTVEAALLPHLLDQSMGPQLFHYAGTIDNTTGATDTEGSLSIIVLELTVRAGDTTSQQVYVSPPSTVTLDNA